MYGSFCRICPGYTCACPRRPEGTVVQELSETEAREIARAEYPVTDDLPATRRRGGWSFAWDRARGDAPVGYQRFIVTDGRVVSPLLRTEHAEDVIASLSD